MSNAQNAALALDNEIQSFKRRGILLNAIVLFPFACIYSYCLAAFLHTQRAGTVAVGLFGLASYIGVLVVQRKLKEKPAAARRAALTKAVLDLWVRSAPADQQRTRTRFATNTPDRVLTQLPGEYVAAVLKAERQEQKRRAKLAAAARKDEPARQEDDIDPSLKPGVFAGFVSGNGMLVNEHTGLDASGCGIGQSTDQQTGFPH